MPTDTHTHVQAKHSPLHITSLSTRSASKGGHYDVCSFLVEEAGANPNLRDKVQGILHVTSTSGASLTSPSLLCTCSVTSPLEKWRQVWAECALAST